MHAYLQRAAEAVRTTAGGLPIDVVARPNNAGWSIGEVLEHLTLAFNANAEALDKIVAAGSLRARRPSVRQSLGRILVIELGYFPRVEAPERTRPRRSIPPERSIPAALEAIGGVDRALSRAADRFGANIAVANHPYFAGLTVEQWRKFHWRHTVHHMRQVRQRAS